jgi:hypothetical protein
MIQWLKRSLVAVLTVSVAGFALGCSGDSSGGSGSGSGSGGGSGGGSDFTTSDKGQIEIEAGTTVNLGAPQSLKFEKGQVPVGSTISQTVTIRNVATGSAALGVDISFVYVNPNVDEPNGPSIKVSGVVAGSETITENNGVWHADLQPLGSGGAEMVVTVEFLRYDDSVPRNGRLTVQSDTRQSFEQTVVIPFTSAEGLPVANVQPKLIDFGQVKAGETPKKPIQVSNTGSDPLVISNVLFQGHPDYGFEYQGTTFEPGEDIQFDPPITVDPNAVETFVVSFTPLTDVPAEGKVVFYTNDPAHPSGILVEIKANTEGPCIQVNPKKVQFGGKLIGNKALLPVEVISCGTADLAVTNVMLTDASNDNFKVDYTTLPGFEDNSSPTGDNPLNIPVNNQATFNVEYVPNIENPLGEDGQPVLDNGIILIESNAFDAKLEIEVTGLGVDKECPTAVGVVQEGEQVIPQTNMHLFGDQSFAPSGATASWKWSAQQPAGSASVFVPSDTFPNPTFEVNTAGEYQFSLEVWDEAGVKSCVPWIQKVLVIPDEAIHVELLWHTPNDPDETDQGPEAGSDVDLHFTHDQYAQSGPDIDQDGIPDGWFDQPFDCFWFNAHPNWGSFDPSIDDDPGLDRDDTDGAGPENLNLNIPENTIYRVGVHYWSDHEYGPSFITLRIYIYSNLVFEVTDVQLVNHDMWDAATIEWPSGKVTLVQSSGGGYKITPNYQNPFFFQP